jgi:hypothetical protein
VLVVGVLAVTGCSSDGGKRTSDRSASSHTSRGQAEPTVHRTTVPEAVQQTGTISTGDGKRTSELVYVVGGTGYVSEGDEPWKKGRTRSPFSSPTRAERSR